MTEEIEKFEPDYTEKCEICGNRPVVTLVKGNEVIHNWHMCGPCVWGEASCLDPEEWNK